MSKLRRIAVVSDLHFGSAAGLLPSKFIDSSGVEVPMNVPQRYLWDCWEDFKYRLKRWDPEAMIVNGDVVEGRQSKEGGLGLSLRLMVDQKAAAVEGIRYQIKGLSGVKLYIVQGTKYHTGENGEAEEDIAMTLGAKQYQSIGAGRYVREVLWLNVGGVIIESAHAIGGSSGFYRATALDREMQWAAMAAKDETKGIPKADLLIRSHVHYFLGLEHASKQGVITPCWQLQTAYARKGSVHRFHPDIGGLFIEIDPDAKRRGEPACRIVKQLYDLPPVPVTKL